MTYDGFSTEDVALVLTEVWNPRDVRKVVEQTSILTCTEDAVNVVWTERFLEHMTKSADVTKHTDMTVVDTANVSDVWDHGDALTA